ncbi:GNAT family N-acetyltransferase [Candidatus Bathyarchaeota archaeon]|nr:GNAT family N-acetyltransferase [Candidatus Bathyarchaeota archaeon]
MVLDLEIRRMKPSEAITVAKVDSYAYQNDPLTVALIQSNSEKARQTREQGLIQMYTINPQETYVAVHGDRIIGFIRSFPCTGLFKELAYDEGEYEQVTSKQVWELPADLRRKWWLMTMKKHDLQTPHSHVGPFGVLPEYQGKGIGSMLMKDYFERLDGVPSYLETFTSVNAGFYVKRGYRLICKDSVLGMTGYWLLRE